MSEPRRAQRPLQALDGGRTAPWPTVDQRAATGAPAAAVRHDGRLTVALAGVHGRDDDGGPRRSELVHDDVPVVVRDPRRAGRGAIPTRCGCP